MPLQSAADIHLTFLPYRTFSHEEWSALRADTPMTLVPRDLKQLSGAIGHLSVNWVERIYLLLPLLRAYGPAGSD